MPSPVDFLRSIGATLGNGAQALRRNTALNPWRDSPNSAVNLGKGLAYSTAAAFPVTDLINTNIYGGLMGRKYKDPMTGKETPGLDPTSKATELFTNAALLLPFFHKPSFSKLTASAPTALTAKGITMMAVPSLSDFFKSTANIEGTTAETKNTATSMGDLFKNLSTAAPDITKALSDQRSWLSPFIGGSVGALAGNQVGRFLEDEGRLTAEERLKQKRSRILLTMLGAGGGALAMDPRLRADAMGAVRGGADYLRRMF